jgi:hypothetical protein
MEGWEGVGNFIVNNGVAIAVVIYFLWKDMTLTKENTQILQQVKALIEHIYKIPNNLYKESEEK